MRRRILGLLLVVVGLAGVFYFRAMLLMMITPSRLNTENVAIVAGPIHIVMALAPVAAVVAGAVLVFMPRRRSNG